MIVYYQESKTNTHARVEATFVCVPVTILLIPYVIVKGNGLVVKVEV